MRTRFLRGNRAANNGLTLANGELAVDTETKALRLHDGTTPGGYEIIGTRAVPGPDQGDLTAGFYGEVAGSNFITYDQLASDIGLSAGVSQHNAESAWLRFSLDGVETYVALKPPRHSLSWDQINAVNAVYNDASAPTVVVGGKTYRVTLLRGATADPTADATGYDRPEGDDSEWNRLLYPVHSGTHTNTLNPTPHTDPNAAPFGSWANYGDSDLILHSDFGEGYGSWCQETPVTISQRIIRGAVGLTHFGRADLLNTATTRGWRPCLRLVS